jgi:8-oxo-dGTP diphosphatase
VPDVPDVSAPAVVPCVGAVVHDASGRLLVVRRGREPGRGRWSVPGGRLEPGETVEQGVAREVREETGLEVTVGPLVGRPRIPGPAGVVYDVADHRAVVPGGPGGAGPDGDEVRWVTAAELAGLPVTDGLREALREWGVGPRA